jgi:AAA15 family ATPase/GTPase
MKNNITSLEISNFKSIKHLSIECKRINILIGEPNVGKSNILEALSLFLAEVSDHERPFLKDYLRYEKLSNLFFDQDRRNMISVKTNIGSALLRFHSNGINGYDISLVPPDFPMDLIKVTDNLATVQNSFDDYVKTNPSASSYPIKPFYTLISDTKDDHHISHATLKYNSPIKRYIFKPLSKHENHFPSFVRPPYGDNLYTILENNSKLYEEASDFFNKYGLDLLMDTEAEKLDIQKRVGNKVYKIPFSLSADTLQRIIFHLAAIETNQDSILLFEEPEAHSFPKYIIMIAEKVIESKENQFFIATHSPYLLTPFIEECDKKDVAIFICTYENFETKIRVLTDEEVGNIMENGIDLFYNIPAFTNG